MDNFKEITKNRNEFSRYEIATNQLLSGFITTIARKINHAIDEDKGLRVKTSNLKRLYKKRGRYLSNINYDRTYKEFNCAYLLKNCIKCFVSFIHIKTFKNLDNYNIVDIGSGGGSVSLAIRNLFKVRQITHIDKSSNQILFAKRLLPEEKKFLNLDFKDFHSYPENYVVTVSYFLCEQSSDSYTALVDRFETDSECKGIIIVDYDDVVKRFSDLISYNKKNLWTISLKLARPFNLILKEKNLITNGIAIFK